MSSNRSTSGRDRPDITFDFDEWHALNKESPEKFELKRKQACQQFIQNAPLKYQQRLKGLLFQIDMQRRKSANPMDSCIRLSGLMWDSFYDLFDKVKILSEQSNRKIKPDYTQQTAAQPAFKLKLVHSREY